jgi:hypothetical protein
MTETLLPIRIPFCRCFGLPRPGPTQRGCTATRRHLRVAAASRYQRRKVTLPRGLSRSRRDGARHGGMRRRPSSRRLARFGGPTDTFDAYPVALEWARKHGVLGLSPVPEIEQPNGLVWSNPGDSGDVLAGFGQGDHYRDSASAPKPRRRADLHHVRRNAYQPHETAGYGNLPRYAGFATRVSLHESTRSHPYRASQRFESARRLFIFAPICR